MDEMFDALADGQRRQLLVDLLDHNPQDVSSMSGVPWEIDEFDRELARKYHSNLPKLADYGYIEWDREKDIVTKGPQFDDVRPLLELLDEYRDELPEDWP